MISPRVGFRVPRASMKATYVCHTTAPILGGGTYNCTDGTGDRFSAFPVVKNCTYTMECNLCPDGEFVVDEDVTANLPFGPYTCGFLYGITESGASNNPYLCEYIVQYGQETCCDGSASSDESSDSRSSDDK